MTNLTLYFNHTEVFSNKPVYSYGIITNDQHVTIDYIYEVAIVPAAGCTYPELLFQQSFSN